MRRSASSRLVPFVLASLGILAGCPDDQVHFHDNLDFVFDFKPFDPAHPPKDHLHSPYVVGAEFRMYAVRDHDRMRLDDAVPETLDPDVMDVWDPFATEEQVDFQCLATGPGTTEIVIRRDAGHGGSWGRAFIEVARPAVAELTFAGPLFIDSDPVDYRVRESVNVLTGGTATFLVEYADAEGRRLYGTNVLQVSSRDEGVSAYADQTYLFEDREWLVITPRAAGDHVVDLKVDDRSVGSVTVHAVTPDDVASIQLRPESESGHRSGDFLAVLALGFTSSGDPVYGIEYDWSVNDFPKAGEGDLYKYEFDRNDRSTLRAAYQGMERSTSIHSDYYDGYVSSTNNIGCATAGVPSGPAALLPMLLPLGLLLLRRRQVARRD